MLPLATEVFGCVEGLTEAPLGLLDAGEGSWSSLLKAVFHFCTSEAEKCGILCWLLLHPQAILLLAYSFSASKFSFAPSLESVILLEIPFCPNSNHFKSLFQAV